MVTLLLIWLIPSSLITLVLLWNLIPHVYVWRTDIPTKHKIAASKSFIRSGWNGLKLLPADLLAPIVTWFALKQTKWEDNKLPDWAAAWGNDVSINGDRPEYWPLDYEGDCYYKPGHHPRSFKARWQWLGFRNRASALSVKYGAKLTPEIDADREHWGDTLTNRDHAGIVVYRAGPYYQYYRVKRLGDKLCSRMHYGYKIWLGDTSHNKTLLLVNITYSILRFKQKPVTEQQG